MQQSENVKNKPFKQRTSDGEGRERVQNNEVDFTTNLDFKSWKSGALIIGLFLFLVGEKSLYLSVEVFKKKTTFFIYRGWNTLLPVNR